MEPQNLDLKMMLNHRRMRNIRRCNNFPTLNQEDVAQHSFYVTMLAMAFADEYNTWAEEHNLEFHPLDNDNQLDLVNTELVLRKALLHDTEESITSDIPWNVKHMNPEVHESITAAINNRIDLAYQGTNTMEIYHKLGKECKDGFEGQFVDVADMVELALFCKEEIMMGNTAMTGMLDKCISLIHAFTVGSMLEKSSPLFNSVMKFLDNPVHWGDYIDIN